MPRIDPLQLLNCLGVLLSPEGGILSRHEVPRLVNLMTKFSKKLVSKCVYILILKNTEQSLVNLFMGEGGWNLIFAWLQDAIQISNWALVFEILSLLLVTPVDVERLKINNIPKLVKSLSRLDDVKGVQALSNQLVHDWLVIVKGTTIRSEEQIKVETVSIKTDIVDNNVNKNSVETVDASQIKTDDQVDNDTGIATATFYTVSVRDGKQVITKKQPVTVDESSSDDKSSESVKLEEKESKTETKKSIGSSNSSSSKSKSSSSSSKSSSSKSKSRDKSKSSSSSSSSSSKSKDREKDRKDSDKDRHRSNGSKSLSNSSSGSSSNKLKGEKQAEKDKDTLAKLKPPSLERIGRIPKKTDDGSKKEPKKPTMSIEVRKNNEERPKTVKVFHSKRRSTGLEEEAKPPPPRPISKTKPSIPTTSLPTKRSSPVKELAPPEKRLKVELPERPGAIKLIPPKPKPPVLQESDMFMDALTASTPKKEAKKRKRRPSMTKDVPSSPQDVQTPTSPTINSPLGLKNITAPNFYQDTLENNEENSQEKAEENERAATPMEEDENEMPKTKCENGIKGVLVYVRRKGPKKSVKFNDNNLTEVRFFELDETERVNVTKNFIDMAKMEMTGEREAIQKSRKLQNEDVMEPQVLWRFPYIIDQEDPLVIPGGKSLEKDIQFAREKSTLQALYFDKRKIPDSAEEPPAENHQMSDPITIPLEDSESQEMDLTNLPWPEPKGAPPVTVQDTPPLNQIYPNIPPIPFNNFNGPRPFQPPRFGPPFNGPMMGPPPEMIHPSLNPNAFGPGPSDHFMMNEGGVNFPMGFNGPPPMNFNNNFNNMRGGHRGGFRRGGNGPWLRMNGPPIGGGGNWGNNRGRGVGGARLCNSFIKFGTCRNMDNCQYVHPK